MSEKANLIREVINEANGRGIELRRVLADILATGATAEDIRAALTVGSGAYPGRDCPRRCYVDLYTPAEAAIRAAVLTVEAAGCSKALTDAVVLLGQAQGRVADHVDGIE